MKQFTQLASIALSLALVTVVGSREANATFIIDVEQVGPNVVFTGSGTLDLDGLSFASTDTAATGVIPVDAQLILGAPSGGDVDV